MSPDYETEYNNRARVPEHPGIIAGWQADAAAYRSEALCELDVSYGEGERQAYDLFKPETIRGNALVMFIHGGYWQALDRSYFSHMARGLNRLGLPVAVVGYDLCPQVHLGHIVWELQQAAAALWRHFTGWYTGGLSCLYNRNRRGEYAAVLGLDAPMRGYGFSYQRPEGDFRLPPPDFSRREVLDQLGRSFAGVNYLASATARDTVARFLLPPGAAERGFPRITPAAGRDIGSVTDGLTRRIRAVQLRTQLAQAKKRLSLP